MIPKEFFVTSGKAISPVSELNAFDLALKNAEIAQCNLVSVSSIIPPKCKEGKQKKIPVGSITFTVLTKIVGKGTTILSAGIAWGWGKHSEYGLVAEAHGKMNQQELRKSLEWKIKEMAKIREIEINNINFKIENLKLIPDNFGCVIAALVFII